jgi:cystathionine beta-lyase/cystathionine gamma-synthase
MKLMTVAAFGVGYIVGTKAGRERYNQIRQLAQTASKNFDASDVLRRLETYRARLEAHSSRAGSEET